MKKNVFAVDQRNRLALKDRQGDVPIKGSFSLSKDNDLVYTVSESTNFLKRYHLTRKINFKGAWKLNENHDLQLLCNQKSGGLFDSLDLHGKVISAEAHAVLFELVTTDNKGAQHFKALKFTGDWRADEKNRLIFTLKKESAPDRICFGAAWELNKYQQISYSYQKTNLVTKKSRRHEISFDGFWQIDAADRISYHFTGDSNALFDFCARLESPTLYPQEGVIKYRLGAGYRQSSREKIISLEGQWKFSRRLGLNFQMQYADHAVHSIEFGFDVAPDTKNKISVSLKNRNGEPLGLTLIFSRKLLTPDAEAFLKLQLSRNDTAVLGGVKIPF